MLSLHRSPLAEVVDSPAHTLSYLSLQSHSHLRVKSVHLLLYLLLIPVPSNQEAMVFRASRNHKKAVGRSTPGRLTTSRNARPPWVRSYTLTPPPCVPPSTTQRPSSPTIAAARRCLRPVCTSATNSGTSGFSSEKIATVSPSGLGSSLFDAYRNGGPPPVSAGASSNSAATRSLSGSSGGRWRVDVVLRRVGSAGSGGRWCVVSVFVSSFSV